nr:MAG TPA: CXCXC repeat protein [Caudoviricetes sp.]
MFVLALVLSGDSTKGKILKGKSYERQCKCKCK